VPEKRLDTATPSRLMLPHTSEQAQSRNPALEAIGPGAVYKHSSDSRRVRMDPGQEVLLRSFRDAS
jgi:hypothetical protein